MRFFTGLHIPAHADKVDAAFISINRIRKRKSAFPVNDWIMDSGAFTEVASHGGYRVTAEQYAAEIKRWVGNGNLIAAVAQDFMCEDPILKRVAIAEGALPAPEDFDHQSPTAWKTLDDDVPWLYPTQRQERIILHQQRTIERYDDLMSQDVGGVYIMPVLQGYSPQDYVNHIRMYGDRLTLGMYVGVGSVCKRNSNPAAIEEVLMAIKRERPDLRIHGFGIKVTSLGSAIVRGLLYTADSMAWSFAARMEGRNANCITEAIRFSNKIKNMPVQLGLSFLGGPA